MKSFVLSAVCAASIATCALSQTTSPAPPPVAPQAPVRGPTLPADTVIPLIAVEEISSINMKVGDTHQVQVASDVVEGGKVIIPRGAPVAGVVTYRTGKGIGGKSAKFEMTFSTVSVGGGKVRQEGRGNTVGALLGSMVITGKSAVITSGQTMTAITDEPIPIG